MCAHSKRSKCGLYRCLHGPSEREIGAGCWPIPCCVHRCRVHGLQACGPHPLAFCKSRYEGSVEGGSCDLVALTAFYEQHYVCFCFSQTVGQGIHYDDDTRRLSCRLEGAGPLQAFLRLLPRSWGRPTPLFSTCRRLVGRDFESVKEKCIAGRLHPQLLFYEQR